MRLAVRLPRRHGFDQQRRQHRSPPALCRRAACRPAGQPPRGTTGAGTAWNGSPPIGIAIVRPGSLDAQSAPSPAHTAAASPRRPVRRSACPADAAPPKRRPRPERRPTAPGADGRRGWRRSCACTTRPVPSPRTGARRRGTRPRSRRGNRWCPAPAPGWPRRRCPRSDFVRPAERGAVKAHIGGRRGRQKMQPAVRLRDLARDGAMDRARLRQRQQRDSASRRPTSATCRPVARRRRTRAAC